MASMSKRLLHDFHLRPMNRDETKLLLHSKLRTAGSDYPEYLFPDAICADIWRASGGWPGVADRVALLALAKAKTLPVSVMDVEHPALPSGTWDDAAQQSVDLPHLTKELESAEPPRLIVTNNGSVMSDLTMQRARLLTCKHSIWVGATSQRTGTRLPQSRLPCPHILRARGISRPRAQIRLAAPRVASWTSAQRP